MSYTTNPYLPRLRMQTANLVIKDRWSVRQVARHTGVNPFISITDSFLFRLKEL